ncbi:hypothetical protein JHN59_03935 [Streptomyces sp. MBT49]|uniref:hypothetical protein n=1 Tax=Streptomyces TaxID=1883 RepID=UPI00190E440C|nr:hypothetical protein [Streptomyces sp. MBT49]MBK3623999.1 hypothetical protein [Streptomyces sp. MBT49]
MTEMRYDEPVPVRVAADARHARVEVNGRDVTRDVRGYQLVQEAGQAPQLLVQLAPWAGVEWEGVARVVVGSPPDPGPAAAAFLAAIDGRELEKATLARHDLLDGQPHEFSRAMLAVLIEMARGDWAGWEPADAVTPEPAPERAP